MPSLVPKRGVVTAININHFSFKIFMILYPQSNAFQVNLPEKYYTEQLFKAGHFSFDISTSHSMTVTKTAFDPEKISVEIFFMFKTSC